MTGDGRGAGEGRLDESALDAAFARAIDAERPPAAYRLRLALVAVAMLLLPVLYLGIVAGTAWLMWLWAVRSPKFLLQKPSFFMGLAYAVPLVAGIVAVVMLLKPFVVRRLTPPSPRVLSRDEEPVLHAFAERVARAVGAPPPRQIRVDLDVNASASLRRGLASFARRDDLVLTIGLPLAAGLSAEELACVLAHEFGHFSQAAGMRLYFLIRTENAWLARIAFERDRWDLALARGSKSDVVYARVFAGSARGLVWAARKVLGAMAWMGHAVSGGLSREMEFGADRRSFLLTGAAAFESAHRRIRRLSSAQPLAAATAREAALAKRRVTDLPALVVAHCGRMGAETDGAGDEPAQTAAVRWLATHPSDRERLERARASGAAACLRIDAPASALFTDLARLCEEVSRSVYDGPAADWPGVSAEVALAQQAENAEERAASRRYLQDAGTLVRPLFPGFADIPSLAAVDSVRAHLAASRELLVQRATRHAAVMADVEQARQRGLLAAAASEYLAAGVKINHPTFGLVAPSEAAAAESRAAAIEDAESAVRETADVEAACAGRLRLALGLLDDPIVTATTEVSGNPRDDAARALAALAAIERAWPDVIALFNRRELMSNLAAGSFASQFEKKVAPRIEGLARSILADLETLRRRLDAPYPFPHDDRRTIGEFAVDVPGEDPTASAASAADRRATDSVLRLFVLFHRLQGRLCLAAERVESALGLPPLPDASPPQPAVPPPAAPRTSHF